MTEIGGFFEFPEFDCENEEDSVYHYLIDVPHKHVFLRDGRQAIKAVLSNFKDKVCYLPAYLCHSILQPFKELELNVEFYRHTHPLKPVIDKDIENSLIFIIEYFGVESVSNEEIIKLLDKGNVVISDITHSIFSKPRFEIQHKNYYLISSLRKVFPIPDGGVVYHTNPDFKANLSFPSGYGTMLAAMKLKQFNRSRDYYISLYRKYENDKDETVILQQNILGASIQILNNLSFSNILKKRTTNRDYLYKTITEKKHLLFDGEEIKSPFFLPLIFTNQEERDKVKERLIAENIFPPVHWELPEVTEDFEYEWDLSSKILSIPCDQRYEEEDMQRIVTIINEVI